MRASIRSQQFAKKSRTKGERMLNAIWALASFAGGGFKRLFDWLKSLNGWQLACLALAVFAGIQTIRVSAEQRHSGKLQTQVEKCTAARKADQDAYRAAQAEAARLNLEDVRKREQKQEQANAEVTADLNARLERLRRELRATGANQGSAGGSGSPQAPGQPGTPQASCLYLTPEELLRGAEDEERHDQLITLIERLIAEQ